MADTASIANAATSVGDPHRAWLDEADACNAERERIFATCMSAAEVIAAEERLIPEIYARQDAALDKLTGTEATTLGGVLAQAELLMRDSDIFDDICSTEHGRLRVAIPLVSSHREDCIRSIHAALKKFANAVAEDGASPRPTR